MAYAHAEGNIKYISNSRSMLRNVYGIPYRKTISDSDKGDAANSCYTQLRVPCAPPREMLKKFGGPLDIKDFRAAGALGIQYECKRTPFIPMELTVEEREYGRVSNVNLQQYVVSRAGFPIAPVSSFNADEVDPVTGVPVQMGNRRPRRFFYRNQAPGNNGGNDFANSRFSSFRVSKPAISKRTRQATKGKNRRIRSREARKRNTKSHLPEKAEDPVPQEAPTVEEQLQASRKRLEKQQQEIEEVMQKPKPLRTLLDFMSVDNKWWHTLIIQHLHTSIDVCMITKKNKQIIKRK